MSQEKGQEVVPWREEGLGRHQQRLRRVYCEKPAFKVCKHRHQIIYRYFLKVRVATSASLFFPLKNCVEIHVTKCTILTMSKCTVQRH